MYNGHKPKQDIMNLTFQVKCTKTGQTTSKIIFASQGFRSRSSLSLHPWQIELEFRIHALSISIGCRYYQLRPIKLPLTIDHGNIKCMRSKMYTLGAAILHLHKHETVTCKRTHRLKVMSSLQAGLVKTARWRSAGITQFSSICQG